MTRAALARVKVRTFLMDSEERFAVLRETLERL